ncbi:MAG: hypothetical protein LRY55_03565, partial [Leadbetterella sp.]|nr:hypothetical protein [Leadbetterella sp.]
PFQNFEGGEGRFCFTTATPAALLFESRNRGDRGFRGNDRFFHLRMPGLAGGEIFGAKIRTIPKSEARSSSSPFSPSTKNSPYSVRYFYYGEIECIFVVVLKS